jgi:glutathione synthase/RimK-type ligase-like ATP-grasp enzyme
MPTLKTLIIVDDDQFAQQAAYENLISFETYLRDYPKLNEAKTRLINLCDTEKYLSKGYYCSLLAESRKHLVFPSVKTINAMRGKSCVITFDQLGLSKKEVDVLSRDMLCDSFLVFMGFSETPQRQKMAARVFRHYSIPIIKVSIHENEIHVIGEAFSALLDEQQKNFLTIIEKRGTLRNRRRAKEYRWEMAILTNEQEKVPPSNKRALGRFVSAAAKLGINAQLFSAEQLLDLNRFDALFIRETTAIDHYTYRIACEAEENGLIVIDDPTSILRCCNKVFLHDAFSYQQIPCLETAIVEQCSDEKLNELEAQLAYPMVLKMPESSFSRGVFKVENRIELSVTLSTLLQDSALIIVQEYVYTEYDWRIGVLNGRPLYACQYFMAPQHWQIYNHTAKRHFSGGFDTMATYEVPKNVLDIALRASKIVGNGLYGVDIKVKGDQAYVIEVNDNPSIDYKVEDRWLGEELYMQVMSEFYRRLELRGR